MKQGNIKKIKWTAISFLMIFAIVLLFNIYFDYQEKIVIKNISDELRLKAPKEKIVTYAEYPSNDNNESIIQYVYGTNQEVPIQIYQGLTEDIAKRTTNSQIFPKETNKTDDGKIEITYIGRFYSGVSFYQDEKNVWYQTQSATTTKTAFLEQTKSSIVDRVKKVFDQPVFAAINTTYSGSGDGGVGVSGQLSWDAAHDAFDGSIVDYTAVSQLVGGGQSILGTKGSTGDNFFLYRYFVPFDTSSLDDSAIISSASLYVMPTTVLLNSTDDGNDFLSVVQTSQLANPPVSLSLTDYDQCGAVNNPIEGSSRIDFSSLAIENYSSLPLNSTGLSWISKTGYTKLGVREGHDILDIPHTGINDLSLTTSEDSVSIRRPYLQVIYSIDSPPIEPPTEDPSIDYLTKELPIKGWAKIIALGDEGWVSLSCDNDTPNCISNYGLEQVNKNFGNCSVSQNITCEESLDCPSGETCNFRQSITFNSFAWSATQVFDGVGWLWFNPPTDVIPPWLQTKFGDIYARQGLSGASSPSFNATYRILSSGGITNFSSESGGSGTLFYDDNFGEINFPTPATRYSNVLGSLDVPGILCDGICGDCVNQFGTRVEKINDVNPLPNPPQGGTIYCTDDDLVVQDPTVFNNADNFNNGAITFVVDGDLIIEENSSYESGSPDRFINLASVAWIVQGDLEIDASVDEIVGDFIVLGNGSVQCANVDSPGCGQIKTCPSGIGCKNRLTVSGLLMAKKFFFDREFPEGDVDQVTKGSEIIIYDGRMLANTPPGLVDFAKALPIWRSGIFSQ